MLDTLGKTLTFVDRKIALADWKEVAVTVPHSVSSFLELTDAVSELTYWNPHLNLYFRGQENNRDVNGNAGPNLETSLLPSAYRKDLSPTRLSSRQYFRQVLKPMEKRLGKYLTHPENRQVRVRQKLLCHFRETLWTVLQHYGCSTPLLDVTQSLHVAASFATINMQTDEPTSQGFVYVLALPNPVGHISFLTNDGLAIVKLQSACPPKAKRPHYQQGYLAGSIPSDPQKYDYGFRDFKMRLVAKFAIEDPPQFWSKGGYSALSKGILMPDDDEMAIDIERMKAETKS